MRIAGTHRRFKLLFRRLGHWPMLLLLLSLTGCFSEPGRAGEEGISCGEHGTAHDGHCDCETGTLFDGTTCVALEDITEVCGEHDHADEVCLCPAGEPCPCDHGEVEEVSGQQVCVPHVHE